MKLDLDKIASARRKLGRKEGPMFYLIDRARREIKQRFQERHESFEQGLIIDFNNGHLILKSIKNIKKISLIEEQNPLFFLCLNKEKSIDVIVMNLQMTWLDYNQILIECHRILKPNGMIYFSIFGPDTLGEVEYIWHQVDTLPHVHPFIDMHIIGDSLIQHGFIKPLMDTEWITVKYQSVEVLIDDLKEEGFINILSERRKTLTGKKRFQSFQTKLWEQCSDGDHLLITFELIFGFAILPNEKNSVLVTPPKFIK